jgi:hypothetical protein
MGSAKRAAAAINAMLKEE